MADTEQYQAQAPDQAELAWIPIDHIDPADDNPREELTGIDELAASIRSVGLLEPVLLEPNGDRFRLVAGARRHAAAKQAGLSEIPALVRAFDAAATRKVSMIVENAERIGLTPLEEAKAYAEILALPGVEVDHVVRQLGRTAAEIDGRLGLLQLPRSVRKQLKTGALSYAEAMLLTQLVKHPEDVTEAVTLHEHGYGMAIAVSQVQSKRERETRAQETRAALEAKGVRIVDDPGWVTRGNQARRLGSGYGAVNVKHSVHRKELCHAAAIGPDGSAVYVCTDPKRHAAEPQSGLTVEPSAKEKRAATRAANQAHRAATAARATKVRELLVPGQEVDVDFLYRAMVLSAPHELMGAVLELLQLEPVGDQVWDRERRTLVAYAAESGEQARRAALALQVAAAEREANAKYERVGTGRLIIPYLDFLAAAGYEELPGDTALRERFGGSTREAA
jgi:ParB/RepB/Spo0J family partition protein